MVKPVIPAVDDPVPHSPADAPRRIAVSHGVRVRVEAGEIRLVVRLRGRNV
jgi:hypothetical protein